MAIFRPTPISFPPYERGAIPTPEQIARRRRLEEISKCFDEIIIQAEKARSLAEQERAYPAEIANGKRYFQNLKIRVAAAIARIPEVTMRP